MPLKRWTALFFVVAASVIAPPVGATDIRNVLTGYTLTSWGTKNGAPFTAVFEMVQDADGYLWLATDAGLVRFDGARFTVWQAVGAIEPAVTSAQALCVSPDGSFWVGWANPGGGVTRVHGSDVSSYSEDSGIPSGAVAALFCDRSGTIWAAHSDGLYRFDGRRWEEWSAGHGLPKGTALAIFEDRQENLLVSMTSDRLFVTRESSSVFRQRANRMSFELVEASADVVRAFNEDASGNVWITDQIAGFRQLGHTARQNPGAVGRGARLLHDSRGNLWVGTGGQGLWRVPSARFGGAPVIETSQTLTGLSDNKITSLLEDKQGNIWVGTLNGLDRLSPLALSTLTDLGLVSGVEVTAEGVWVGTTDGVIQFDARETTRARKKTFSGASRAPLMYADEHGTLWVAANDGLFRVKHGQTIKAPLAKRLTRVTAMTSDFAGGLWLNDASEGLLRLRGDRLELAPFSAAFHHSQVRHLHVDHAGQLWIAFLEGGVGVVNGDGDVRMYGPKDGLTGGTYFAFFNDADNVIWLGGTLGLTRYANGTFVTFGRSNGFSITTISAIESDHTGHLWLGARPKIIRVEKSELEKAAADPSYQISFAAYDKSDGMAGNPIALGNHASARAADGTLWFVTSEGLAIVDPNKASPPQRTSLPLIDFIVADGQRLKPTPATSLPPLTRRLEIEYALLELTSPQKTSFRYRLEGFDRDWVQAGTRRRAVYTNLPPRQFKFELVASNKDGTWPAEGAIWQFSVRPKFYQTIWFALVCVVALTATTRGIWIVRSRYTRRQFEILLHERARLSREIHDTLLQSLIGTALHLGTIGASLTESQGELKRRIVRMRKQVEDYIREARQSILELRSPMLERFDLSNAFRETADRIACDSQVTFNLAINGQPIRGNPKIEEQLLRIGSEAMLNAVRHADPTHVRVELHYGVEAVALRVSDDGHGFDVNARGGNDNGHCGLRTMYERAEEIGAEFTIHSEPGSGTHIEVTVPTSLIQDDSQMRETDSL